MSCSSEKNTAVSRNYHTLVSHFNGFYHAEQKYKEAVGQMEKTLIVPQTGYISLLALSETGQAGSSPDQSSFPQLDVANKKCDLIIFRHKNGKYVDDSYLLKGKCAYQKGNYYEAIVDFEHIKRKFPESPLLPAGALWTAKAHLMSQNPYRAKEAVTQLKKLNLKMDKELKVDLAELDVTLKLMEGQVNEALVILEQHLELVKGRRRKARWNYLMGQLYTERTGYTKAVEAYQRVVKLNAGNEITFSAKLRIVELYLQNQPGSPANTEYVAKLLKKMARDGKYKEFRDQIYYRYAEMALKKPDYAEALTYLRKSINASIKNPSQKAESYFSYAEISFKQLQQLNVAQAYYDSAAAVVPKEHPKYDLMKRMAETFKSYATYKSNIQIQDSLVALSKLTDKELSRYVDDLIDREEAEKENQLRKLAEQKREEEQRRMNDLAMMRNTETTGAASTFGFDDPNQVAKGKSLFERNWGTSRTNEDHWRRSNKRRIATTAGNPEQQMAALAPSSEEELAKRKKTYLANIPKSPQQRQQADSIISSSLFELAVLFDQKLMMPDSATHYYEELLRRYPDAEIASKVWYSLYILHKDHDKPRDAERCKNQILEKYPKSLYAKLIRQGADDDQDSDYDFKQSYQNLYNLYQSGAYHTVIELSEYMINSMLDHPDIHQVYYLQGLAKGGGGDQEGLKTTFQFLVSNFPEKETASIAKQTLRYLGVAGMEPVAETKVDKGAKSEEDPAFAGFSPRKGSEPISVVMFVDDTKLKSKDLEVLMSNFGT
ncbi:MAG: tetratricopeptide repeat protein, partial [Bacteroidetes bacterium]|nr:tetratricopeptide repeat protein [Bacteroidota bacterium]